MGKLFYWVFCKARIPIFQQLQVKSSARTMGIVHTGGLGAGPEVKTIFKELHKSPARPTMVSIPEHTGEMGRGHAQSSGLQPLIVLRFPAQSCPSRSSASLHAGPTATPGVARRAPDRLQGPAGTGAQGHDGSEVLRAARAHPCRHAASLREALGVTPAELRSSQPKSSPTPCRDTELCVQPSTQLDTCLLGIALESRRESEE